LASLVRVLVFKKSSQSDKIKQGKQRSEQNINTQIERRWRQGNRE